MIRNIDAKFKKPYNNCNLRKIIYHQYLPMFMSIFNLRGAQTDRFRYEVFQNLFFSPMNTGFLRDTVATVLTVYGIETFKLWLEERWPHYEALQQYLPFTVLKLNNSKKFLFTNPVATVLTVYGIETSKNFSMTNTNNLLQQYLPFTVLKLFCCSIACCNHFFSCNSTYRLRY